jgi:acyl-CoA thioesterase FadM
VILREVDQWLAAQQACAFRVRLLHGDDTELRGEVRDAGELSRRDSRRSVRTDADLAAEATITWVVPRRSEGLVSPACADVPGVTILAEHAAVTDDIGDLLLWPGAVSVTKN